MMQVDAGLSVAAGGWLASANYLGYLVGALSATRVRLAVPVAIRAALLAIALTTFAMGVTEHFALWVVLRTLSGIASAWVLIHVSAWSLERLAPAARPILNGTVFAGVGVGIALAGVVCLALMARHARSATAWLVLGGTALLITLVVWAVFGGGAASSGPSSQASRAKARHPDAVRLVLCYGAYGFGYIIPATFLPVMARDSVADPDLFGWAWPAFGAAAAASTLLASRLARFMSHRAIWIAGQLLMALGVVIPLFVPGLAGILLAALLVGGTFMVVTMAGLQEARASAGARARALMAAMTSAFALGQIAGPVSVSYLVGVQGGFERALVIAAALLALGAVALIRR
jgi:MFS family permease